MAERCGFLGSDHLERGGRRRLYMFDAQTLGHDHVAGHDGGDFAQAFVDALWLRH